MATLVLRTVKGSPLTNAEVDGNFSNINTEVGVVNSNVGLISALTTSVTSNVVYAVNSVNNLASNANSNVGVLSNLSTTAKTNVVSAINEVRATAANAATTTTVTSSSIVFAIALG